MIGIHVDFQYEDTVSGVSTIEYLGDGTEADLIIVTLTPVSEDVNINIKNLVIETCAKSGKSGLDLFI